MQRQVTRLGLLEGVFLSETKKVGCMGTRRKFSSAAMKQSLSMSAPGRRLLFSPLQWRSSFNNVAVKQSVCDNVTNLRALSTITNEQSSKLLSNNKPSTTLIKRSNQTSSSSTAEATDASDSPIPESESSYHNIIKDSEKAKGDAEKREFEANTRQLLDIVAKSLYSESEIFIRELISNASDALEKFRYLSLSGEKLTLTDRPLEIHLATDKTARTFTIQDTGVGLTKEEMIENLGTIAKSGSKAFLEKIQEAKGSSRGGVADPNAIIGQFGVGFYSSFMVANKVEVYSKSSIPGSQGYKWTSDGSGSYEIQECEGVQEGTKIVVHLKGEHRQFCDEQTVQDIVKKYSNFVGSPVYLNGNLINTVKALWLMDPKEVTKQQHEEFYKFVGGSFDRPRFTLHFRTDVPLSLRALLYFPESKPGLFEMSREMQVGVSLYARKVLIKNRADNLLPTWLRFLKGAVDSEDIPLNLSRELLQEGSIIRKLKIVLVNRILRFLQDRAQKEPEEYAKFYQDYGVFLKEGIIIEHEQIQKEEIAKLLRFESSLKPAGELVSIPEYVSRMQAAQKDVYYLSAPSRELAENSPYLEAMKQKNHEVLFCYENYDEIMFLQLRQFDSKNLVSVEKEMRTTRETVDMNDLTLGMDKNEAESLISFLQGVLKGKASVVKITQKLSNHPCVVTVEEMSAARHFVKTQFQTVPLESRYSILQPHFEINVKHPLIKKLAKLKDTDDELARLLAEQLFANSMIIAGLENDPRQFCSNLTELLTKTFQKV